MVLIKKSFKNYKFFVPANRIMKDLYNKKIMKYGTATPSLALSQQIAFSTFNAHPADFIDK
jgi:hypothetical protein